MINTQTDKQRERGRERQREQDRERDRHRDGRTDRKIISVFISFLDVDECIEIALVFEAFLSVRGRLSYGGRHVMVDV